MLYFIVSLTAIVVVSLLLSPLTRTPSIQSHLRHLLGLSHQKISRLLYEFRRKTWHLVGLAIPVIYYGTYRWFGWSRERICWILGILSLVCIAIDLMRIYVPCFQSFYMNSVGGLLRKKEKETLSGSTYFLIGSFLTCVSFSVLTAVTAVMFLTLGDMAAAIIGITFGHTKLLHGKSLEGCFACFFTCFTIAMITFSHVDMVEYIAFWGALSATLSELLITTVDDNLTIPLFGGLGLTIAQYRLWNFAKVV